MMASDISDKGISEGVINNVSYKTKVWRGGIPDFS